MESTLEMAGSDETASATESLISPRPSLDTPLLSQADNQLNSRAGFEPRSRPKGMLTPFGNPI
jgi:hypothetical protein